MSQDLEVCAIPRRVLLLSFVGGFGGGRKQEPRRVHTRVVARGHALLRREAKLCSAMRVKPHRESLLFLFGEAFVEQRIAVQMPFEAGVGLPRASHAPNRIHLCWPQNRAVQSVSEQRVRQPHEQRFQRKLSFGGKPRIVKGTSPEEAQVLR